MLAPAISGRLRVGPVPERADSDGDATGRPAPTPPRLWRTVGEPALPREVSPTMKRVLVVDDNADSAESLSLLLELMGHTVRTAHDGEQALAEAESFRPELVLMDIGMPRMDGYEAARRLRQAAWAAARRARRADRLGPGRRQAPQRSRRFRSPPDQAGRPGGARGPPHPARRSSDARAQRARRTIRRTCRCRRLVVGTLALLAAAQPAAAQDVVGSRRVRAALRAVSRRRRQRRRDGAGDHRRGFRR